MLTPFALYSLKKTGAGTKGSLKWSVVVFSIAVVSYRAILVEVMGKSEVMLTEEGEQ